MSLLLRVRRSLKTARKKQTKRWSNEVQAEFFRLFADLLAAGFGLAAVLQSLMKLLPQHRDALKQIHQTVATTGQLAAPLKPYVSTNTYYQLLIAEQHGDLISSIKQIGELSLQRSEQQKKLRSLLSYPLLLFVMLIGIVVAVQLYVRPLLQPMMASSQTHPVLMQNLIVHSLLALGAVGGSLLLIKVIWWWSKQSQITRHHWYCQLPVVGKLYRTYSHYYLAYNLGLLLKSGMNLEQICRFLEQFDEKSLLAQLGKQLQLSLLAGEDLSKFIRRYPFIPPELTLFLNKGQTQPALAVELLLYANITYRKFLRQVDRLIGWVQPALFIVLALGIIGTYLMILLPLYQQMGGMTGWRHAS